MLWFFMFDELRETAGDSAPGSTLLAQVKHQTVLTIQSFVTLGKLRETQLHASGTGDCTSS